ncbi:ATP-binding protein [Prevotella denticola]|uniref:ATP-binding protein n=1 Tax=Prevotella denticola TaxID=28129 RepID=UPI002431B3B5|nr:ATP-binding protein [Prevotella denticola]
MEVNIKQALKVFFSKSSFEMIYFEAFANALDAGATDFYIDIKQGNELKELSLVLTDNGIGFTDERFRKFGKLFDVEEEPSHKGLGRLVYLCYFGKVHVESCFNNSVRRVFDFDESFSGTSQTIHTGNEDNGTVLTMTEFLGTKLGRNDYIKPSYIKNALLENFYMKFYKAKLVGRQLNIFIRLFVDGQIVSEETITTDSMPSFSVKELTTQMDFFNSIDLYYYVREVEIKETKVITALAIDDRSHRVEIIADENLPKGYEMIFLLISESFQGNIDGTRQNLTISDNELTIIKTIFRNGISEVIKEQFPQINKNNEKRVTYLKQTFPHLCGYFDNNDIGYSSQTDILKKAQDKFFRDQKEILGAKELNDEQFNKSLDLSARALTEYILFRQNVIKRMKGLDKNNKEEELHNLIAPKYAEFHGQDVVTDMYRNNVWVLDDKFMSYSTVLSEAEMSRVIDVLTEGEVRDKDNDRPDITLFFSGNPNESDKKVDVVVVELKRLGLSAEQNSIVEFQLDTRTRRLAEYYGNRIQRMWFYGIVDFDDQYEMHLRDNYFKPLFSNGKIYFRSKQVSLNLTSSESVIQNAYILDFSAMVEDANSRNSTFLKILQHSFENESSK